MRRPFCCALFIGAFCLVWATGSSADAAVKVGDLRCEYVTNPLGVEVVHPRLSWVLTSPQRGEMQTAYQVLVASSEEKLKAAEGDLWDSGKVNIRSVDPDTLSRQDAVITPTLLLESSGVGQKW